MSTGALLANSHSYDPDSGEWINERFQRIAEIIHDLSSSLSLVWIPPAARQENDLEPYAVAHTGRDGEQYIFMYIKEEELDERVIAQILEASSDTLIERMNKMDSARELLKLKEEEERMAQSVDLAASMWRSPLHTYRTDSGRRYNL